MKQWMWMVCIQCYRQSGQKKGSKQSIDSLGSGQKGWKNIAAGLGVTM